MLAKEEVHLEGDEGISLLLTGQPLFHVKQSAPLFALNSRFLGAPDNPVQSCSRVAMYK